MALGKENFGQDAKQVMEVFMNLQGSSQLEDDDPTTSYMLQAWARLCKCLAQVSCPTFKPDVMIMEIDDSDDDLDSDDASVETITIIRTSFLEGKATSCNMLCCYADELKNGFYPCIVQVAPVLSVLAENFTFMKKFARQLCQELEAEVLIDMLDGLKDSLQTVGTLIEPSQMKIMVDEFKQAFTASGTR